MQQLIKTAIKNYTGCSNRDVTINVIADEFVDGTYAARMITLDGTTSYFLITDVFCNATVQDIEDRIEDVEYAVWPPNIYF